jgi:hypothetical protein
MNVKKARQVTTIMHVQVAMRLSLKVIKKIHSDTRLFMPAEAAT